MFIEPEREALEPEDEDWLPPGIEAPEDGMDAPDEPPEGMPAEPDEPEEPPLELGRDEDEPDEPDEPEDELGEPLEDEDCWSTHPPTSKLATAPMQAVRTAKVSNLLVA